jgi:cyclase
MLTKRIIACLDCNAGRVVKGVNFVNLRDAGDPAELALKHAESGADEIVLLDITATHEGRKTMFDTVRRTARSLFVPLTVGGGVRTLADAGAVFEAGCDKLSINSAAVKDPSLITCIAERFGSQAVIVAIDAKRESSHGGSVPDICEVGPVEEKKFRVYVAGGRTPTERYVLEWAREAESRGAGEILLTSMDRDGTGIGFDCELTAAVAKTVSIPVIASGGAGGAQHFVEVFQQGHADAALAASIFHFGINDIGELKLALRASGIPVRWPC